jgi:hypothetical protein
MTSQKKGLRVAEHALSKIYADNPLILKFFFASLICLILYLLATVHLACWIAVSAVAPAGLVLYHFYRRPIFAEVFRPWSISTIKCVTFILQNSGLILCYFFLPPKYFSLYCLWVIRLNVFECLVDFFLSKEYALCLPTLFLLIGMNLTFTKDPQFIAVISSDSLFFIVEYTLWFIAWISVRYPWRWTQNTHALMPLFFPPRLWYSVRTLTGMTLLIYSYIPFFSQNIIDTTRQKGDLIAFAKIYKQLYLILWGLLYLYRFCYRVL